jgi:hypothetical protein
MNVFINSPYIQLEEFIKKLPLFFDKEGQSIYKSRNELKIFENNGLLLNVKRYRKPHFINRVAYTFFRKSKAKRAYENALILLSKGFETPMPVAYLEIRQGGLLKDSYFISFQCPYTRLFREFADGSTVSGREDILQSFGVLLARLHEAGILHLDLSVGNVLFEKKPDGFHFSLVDLNRMKFKKIGLVAGCRNFERLRGNNDFFRILTETYARERGFDAETCLKLVLDFQEKSERHFQRKRRLKRALYR